jgi:lipopolysaccharide biosynthesis regulator YciM
MYRCLACGQLCTHLIWALLGIERAEERCPACGKWAAFELADEKRLEKAA